MTFADKLKELRDKKGWTQKELAGKAGQSFQAIIKWERGDRAPSFAAVQKLCAALGTVCTVFDGCDFGAVEDKRGLGRPVKAPAEAKTAGPNSARKPPRKKSKD